MLLKRIGELSMNPDVQITYMEMEGRLSIAEEQLNALVSMNEEGSNPR